MQNFPLNFLLLRDILIATHIGGFFKNIQAFLSIISRSLFSLKVQMSQSQLDFLEYHISETDDATAIKPGVLCCQFHSYLVTEL